MIRHMQRDVCAAVNRKWRVGSRPRGRRAEMCRAEKSQHLHVGLTAGFQARVVADKSQSGRERRCCHF